MKDKHDPRDFDQFVILHADGTVAGVQMVAKGSEHPKDGDRRVYLNVTALGPVPLDDVAIDPQLVEQVRQKTADLEAVVVEHARIFTEQATAQRVAETAFAAAVKAKA